MPPENLRLYAERLATLEAQHKAMEKEHESSLYALSERLTSHIEETDRQLVAVQANLGETQMGIDTLTKTVGEFITNHNALENAKKDKKIELWQWLAIIGVFVGPTVFEKILKFLGLS